MTLFHIGVKSAFDLVNSFPVAIKKNVTKFEADLLENELMSLGATIEIVTAEEDERNSIHSVILMEHGPNTVSLVATISMLLNISLTDAKGLVDKADKTPVILKERVNFYEAMSFKRLIEGYDAKIEVKTNVDELVRQIIDEVQ